MRTVRRAAVGEESLLQIIADRAEQAAVILTTNLPFSEWPHVNPDARLTARKSYHADPK